MKRLWMIVTLMMLALAACGGPATPTQEVNPEEALREAIINLRGAESFALEVQQNGAPYQFLLNLGPDQVNLVATMSRATGNFVAPDNIFASINVNIGANINANIFAKSDDQWLRISGGPWVKFQFAPGFEPQSLLAEDEGFEAALSQLRDLEYIGREVRFGVQVDHVRGGADGAVVNNLLFGLVELPDTEVIVDTFIEVETNRPVEIMVTLPDTATDAEPEDSRWNIEIFDYNNATEFDRPEEVEL